jgi:hypothetical protein
MMTHELEVSVVAAPLEAIDPRMLSQAWYSALNIAAHVRPISAAQPAAGQRFAKAAQAYRVAATRTRQSAKPYLYPKRSVRAVRRRAHAVEPPALRRSPQSRLAARIERTFAAPPVPRRATFSLGRGNARVHIVLQTTPTRTMLIALCRPELRADVGQALVQARMALAARGIRLDLRALGGSACS